MPYTHSRGNPDFGRVLETGDPRWATRKPAGCAKRNRHSHAPPASLRYLGAPVRVDRNELHGSTDSYYIVNKDYPCNCVVLPTTDPRIRWEYDRYSARQCARPYVESGAVAPQRSNVVKVARRFGKPSTTFVVHPEVWKAIETDTRAPPGDAVAALHRMDPGDRAAEVAALREGAAVCVYFKH